MYTNVQTSLTTKSEENSVRLFALDNVDNVFSSNREEIDLVSKTVGSLDSSDIWVNENGSLTLFLKGLDSLGAY